MLMEGVDLDDPDDVAAWIDEFNDRDEDERFAVLSGGGTDDGIGGGFRGTFAVSLPTENEARESAAQSRLLANARGLVDFVGEGRKVTQTGAVTLSDARALVDLLQTGDAFDETIGARTFKTHSSKDLPGLSFIVRLATAARFVRVVKGRLVSTKAGRSLGRDSLADLCRLTEAIDELGVVTARFAGNQYVWGQIAPYFDDAFESLAAMLLQSEQGLPFVDIVEWMFECFERDVALDNPHWTEQFRRDLVASEIGAAISTLESAGLATWDGEIEQLGLGATKRSRGTVVLTPAGRWAIHWHLTENCGVLIRTARPVEHTLRTFSELVHACERTDPNDFPAVMREIEAWIAHRGDEALAQLIDAARTTDDIAVRNMALAVTGQQFGADAEQPVRSLVDHPETRASALLWLVDHELEPAATLLDPDRAVFVEVLALILVSRGPEAMVATFCQLGSDDAQLAVIDQLWRLSTPEVGPVLEFIGRSHTTKKVAKGARKAAMQHHTRQANLRGSATTQ